jgi:hypothetical protein
MQHYSVGGSKRRHSKAPTLVQPRSAAGSTKMFGGELANGVKVKVQ